MFEPNSAPTQQTTSPADPSDSLRELDHEIARQDTELAQALEWLRQQDGSALPADSELLDQSAALDRLTAETRRTGSPSVPEHSTRC